MIRTTHLYTLPVGNIDAIITGLQVNISAVDGYDGAFNSFIRMGNGQISIVDRYAGIRMDAIIFGGQDQFSTIERDTFVGMDSIILGINLKGSTIDSDIDTGFQTFGAVKTDVLVMGTRHNGNIPTADV